MEEDAGKLVHDDHQPLSYVDFNRTGVPLIEIVSEPDIATPEEAAAYLKSLREILRYLDICDGNMEEGSMRCDANISLRPVGTSILGTKIELKNMNSFKNVQKALEFEIRRQKVMIERGDPLVQETRLWDAGRNVTLSMRSKEEAHDYRYFPDPDLIPLAISEDWIEQVRSNLPELPEAKRERFIKEYALPAYDAKVLTSSKSLANYFEAAVKKFERPKTLSNWIMSELLRELNRDDREIEECPVTPENLAELLHMLDSGVISGKIAKAVFEKMYADGRSARQIVDEEGLTQVSDESEIETVIEQVLSDNPKEVDQLLTGKEKLFGFLVGQVMRKTKGKANPQLVNEILRKKLESFRRS
jgi:aspartyl-tRNA(Asn)/glutamyl-tRNA(Gln) amidotransferase subunit B